MKIPHIVNLRNWFFPILTGFLYALSFPLIDANALAWIAFVPLLIAIRHQSPRKAFWIGQWSGLIAFIGCMYWVTISLARYGGLPWPATLPFLLLLSAYMALYMAVFSAGLVWIQSKLDLPSVFVAPVIWTSLEWIRAHAFTGFPWALLGYSQYSNIQLIQFADITGIYGISFLIILVNAAIVDGLRFLQPAYRRRSITAISVAMVALVAAWIYGHQRLAELSQVRNFSLNVGVVQANIPQNVKWSPKFRQATFDRYAELTAQVSEKGVDLIVWPEAAMPFVFDDETFLRRQVLSLIREVNTPVLFGSPGRASDTDQNPTLTNSAYLVDGSGQTVSRQDKIHLVPFGEYVPLSDLLFFVDKMVDGIGNFRAGTEPRVMNLRTSGDGSIPIGVVICFEIIFPELVRAFAKKGAEVMVAITNDAWFGRSSAPHQHFSMMVFRSIENRVPFIRAANTGISGFVDESGHILDASDIFTEATLTREVKFSGTSTVYNQVGDLFVVICGIISAALILFRLRLKKPL